ncbi:MAG: pyridoxal-phosphate dependent enzyme [Theionarchaea archaeon]|nr:pyridoxal-phosphate dependent enzyme [Theionarchaea archaeon]MBU7036683.1 pyridoxal-phosphate dependent enzyme [Theionarchaea archaeon]
MMYERMLKCLHCGAQYPLERMFEGCPRCKTDRFQSNVVVDYDYEKIKETVSRKVLKKRCVQGVWKWQEFLPVDPESSLTLGEGGTPLLPCRKLGPALGLHHLCAKDESRNPTHTFKDRSAAVGATVARKFGSRHLIAGGGNTAAAAAAYGAVSGLQVISFENQDESMQAILQTLSYGGKVVYLKKYEDRYVLMKTCVDTLHAHPVSSYTRSPTGDPYSEEGRKTVAFEICEQLSWNVPDYVIVPTGMGFGLFAVWRGFQDLYTTGFIDALPQMVAVESSAGGSLTKTLTSGAECIQRVETAPTIAKHILVPQVGYQAYRAVKDSGGVALTVEDGDILEAVFSLATHEGIYASTTSAAAIAAAKTLHDSGHIDAQDTVVSVITGGGLKDPDVIETHFSLPDPVGGEWDKFVELMKTHYNMAW